MTRGWSDFNEDVEHDLDQFMERAYLCEDERLLD